MLPRVFIVILLPFRVDIKKFCDRGVVAVIVFVVIVRGIVVAVMNQSTRRQFFSSALWRPPCMAPPR